MKIAIEATAAVRSNPNGIAVYTTRLIDALIEGPARGDQLSLGYRLSRFRQRENRHHQPKANAFWIQEPILPLFHGFNVVHGTDGRVPHWKRSALIATVHDVGPLIYPEFSSPSFCDKVQQAMKRLVESCQIIIADSAVTRTDILNHFDFPPERVRVVHLGVDDVYSSVPLEAVNSVRRKYQLPEEYIFYVGEVSRRKNSQNMIEGYVNCAAATGMPLVIAGAISYGGQELLSGVEHLGIKDRVKLLGYVPDADLPPLHSGARTFLFPTCYEGFGIPVLEAMYSGVPVVGGNRGSVPEVAGGHAELADPDDPTEIAAALARALNKSQEEVRAAREHAAGFTWQKCAEKTYAVYQEAQALL